METLFFQRDSTAEEKFGDQGLKLASAISAVEAPLLSKKLAQALGVLEGPLQMGRARALQAFLPVVGRFATLHPVLLKSASGSLADIVGQLQSFLEKMIEK